MQTFRIPFHTVNGMVLLDAVVDGKPASLLPDIGADNTIVSAQAVGVATVQLRSLQATKAGPAPKVTALRGMWTSDSAIATG